MLELIEEKIRPVDGVEKKVRTYKNKLTGTCICTYLLYEDAQSNAWWAFEDLFAIPFIRQLAAKKVVDLYGHGLSLDDIISVTGQLKIILKSEDLEKYEKCFAKVLELENISYTMSDPVKQCIGLCTLYILLNEEPPDSYLKINTDLKLSILSVDINAQSFFLNWWAEVMRFSGNILKNLSKIVSNPKIIKSLAKNIREQ